MLKISLIYLKIFTDCLLYPCYYAKTQDSIGNITDGSSYSPKTYNLGKKKMALYLQNILSDAQC